MNSVLIISVAIIGIVMILEGMALFLEGILDKECTYYYAIIPIFSDDEKYMEKILNTIENTNAKIILVNYDANQEQITVCKNYTESDSSIVFLESESLDKYFQNLT